MKGGQKKTDRKDMKGGSQSRVLLGLVDLSELRVVIEKPGEGGGDGGTDDGGIGQVGREEGGQKEQGEEQEEEEEEDEEGEGAEEEEEEEDGEGEEQRMAGSTGVTVAAIVELKLNSL